MNTKPTLAEATASPDFHAELAELTARVAGCTTEAEVLELLVLATQRVGADASAFVSFVRDDPAHESFRFLLACDPVWCFEYEQHAWYADDPWLAYARSRSEPVRGSEIAVESKQQAEIVELAHRYGFRSAAIVPAQSGHGLTRVGVLCLGSATEGYFEGDGFGALRVAMRSLALELHEWWIGQVGRELQAEAGVDEHDLTLLRHERHGRSTKEIARELNASVAAIDSRFRRLNARLGVPNRKAAAHLAAEYGLI